MERLRATGYGHIGRADWRVDNDVYPVVGIRCDYFRRVGA